MLAWLHAVPQPPEDSRRDKAGKRNTASRLDKMRGTGVEPQMPPNPLPGVIHRLVEMGITGAGGMGPRPLGWADIDAWSRGTGVELMPWEFRLIRHLSSAYLGELGKAESENRPPPWGKGSTAAEARAETAALTAVLG